MGDRTVEQQLAEAAAGKRAAAEAARAAAERFEDVVEAALRSGLKPAQVAEVSGYSYETIRTIARARGVDRLREPTVTSRRRLEHGESSS